MQRRTFLLNSALVAGGVIVSNKWMHRSASEFTSERLGPVWGFDPVVGDGKWIWREPPELDRGYLEPRSYELRVGIELTGVDDACEAIATTPVPTSYPEQSIDDVSIETDGCSATIRELAPGASQLFMHAPNIAVGQVVRAIAVFKLTLYKQYHAFAMDQFPSKPMISNDIRIAAMGDSTGIQANAPGVRKLAMEIAKGIEHPWMKAQAFVEWIRKNIRPQIGSYTSVLTAIQKKVGDCEEMSALFVAFCRASGIPARLVWVPNHNWAEFYLTDHEGQGHWIPAHPACYNWFGWTGVHELVIQKGDRVTMPETNASCRLMLDWMRSSGRPKSNYIGELKPLPNDDTEGSDAGPGQRTKDSRTGEWKLTGRHAMDRYARR